MNITREQLKELHDKAADSAYDLALDHAYKLYMALYLKHHRPPTPREFKFELDSVRAKKQ